jgi:endonuclease YncB( thermonuclease family)
MVHAKGARVGFSRQIHSAGWTRRRAALGLAGLDAGCSAQGDLAEGESGRIARITDGDVLGLETSLGVRLVEVEAPAPGYDGRLDEPWAAEARDLLTAVALGRQARLWYGGLSRDDYGRALAHVIASDETSGDVWLNGMAIRQGAARVRSWPANSRRARKLLALEAEARAAKRGLWALERWRVRGLDDLEGAPNYAIVEGAVAQLGEIAGDGEVHLARGGIKFDVGQRLGAPDGLTLLVGSKLRMRGRIDSRDVASGGEPKIRITHWAQVELA